MTGIGVAVIEFAALLDQRRGDPVADQKRGKRLIAGGQRLGGGDRVGLNAERLRGKPLAGAAIAGDDLVEHQKHVVLAAQGADLGQGL